ncbi:MAG TPA: D-glucuronyl C5-epimerase family protein [Solirubrobacteraceae bacterium]
MRATAPAALLLCLAALLLGLAALGTAQPTFAASGAGGTQLGPVRGPVIVAAPPATSAAAAAHVAGGRSSAAPVLTRAHAGAARGPTVSRALSTLLGSGAISEATYKQDLSIYVAAKRSVSRLSGTRREELAAVLANVQSIAAAGLLSGSRQAAVFLTLQQNRHWWTTEPLLSSGERITFPPSKLIWQYYPGQGVEIQWLATFGKGNGYYLSGHEYNNLRQLVEEAIPLATQRAGGIAWEYLFRFDGGVPPWTSGLSQGTALQVLSRAWSRFKQPAFLTAAQQALGIFQTPPPSGVRVTAKAGAGYAQYSYAPSDRILNGFIQAVVGLYDYTSITKDPLGLKLFEAGDAAARAQVPHYDTGAWSLYDQYGESSLSYHELLTEFLQHLCERTRKGAPVAAATTPPPSGTTTPTTTNPTTTTPVGAGGGTAPSAHAAATASTQIAGDEIYCTTAQRFSGYLRTPPVVSLLSTKLKGGTRAGLKISLSKISTVTWTIHRNGRTVYTNRATLEGGKPRLLWLTPAAGGTFTVTLTAGDLAGNFSSSTGTIVVTHR